MTRIHLYKRTNESRYWHALVYLHGRRHRFTCRTTDRSTAKEYARKRILELEQRRNQGLSGFVHSVAVSEVFDRYERQYAPKLRLSARNRMMDVVKQARDWFSDGPLNDPVVEHITSRDIQAFLELKRSEGVSASARVAAMPTETGV